MPCPSLLSLSGIRAAPSSHLTCGSLRHIEAQLRDRTRIGTQAQSRVLAHGPDCCQQPRSERAEPLPCRRRGSSPALPEVSDSGCSSATVLWNHKAGFPGDAHCPPVVPKIYVQTALFCFPFPPLPHELWMLLRRSFPLIHSSTFKYRFSGL